MGEFEKDKGLMNGKGESDDVKWITVNGAHIPIKDDQSPEEALTQRFDKVGKNENKKSNEIIRLIETLKKIKKIKSKELIDFIKNLKPINLQIKDREIMAQFDIHTGKENIFGDKFSDSEGYNYKLNHIEQLPDFIKDSHYSYSSHESGKKIKTHKGVKEWHYFVNQIQTDKGIFDININIRDKGDNQFIYLVTFKKKHRG